MSFINERISARYKISDDFRAETRLLAASEADATSVAAASLTTAPLAVSTAAHDREWWAAEAARCCTDWEGIVETHFAVLTNLGLLERKPAIMTELDENAWTAPGWREAAVEYHKDRRDCRLVIEIDAKRLARLRRLPADEISLDRVLRSNFQKGFS